MITKITEASKNAENKEKTQAPEDNVIQIQGRSKTPFMIAGLILLAVLGVGAYFYFNRTYTKYAVDSSVPRTDETAMEYIAFQGGFIKYNVDGITYEDKSGTIVWTEAFTMTDPKVVTRGEYAVVTDIGNNEYMLYSANKKIGNFTTDYPITDIKVAQQGLVAVVLEDEKVNYIVAFDRSGTKCVEIKTTINKNGYPLAIALSEDGKKLVASYITIEGTQVESALTFYNFGDVGKNEVDRQVGYKKFKDELFPRMEFVTNDTVCAFGDGRMVLYSMKQKPKEIVNKKIKDSVKSIFYNESYVGYICKKEQKSSGESTQTHEELDVNQSSADEGYTIKAFNLKGKLVLTQDIDFNYTDVHSTGDEVVVISDTECQIFKYNGFLKYHGTFEEGIGDFFPTTRKNHYILITGDNTQMIHLK